MSPRSALRAIVLMSAIAAAQQSLVRLYAFVGNLHSGMLDLISK